MQAHHHITVMCFFILIRLETIRSYEYNIIEVLYAVYMKVKNDGKGG